VNWSALTLGDLAAAGGGLVLVWLLARRVWVLVRRVAGWLRRLVHLADDLLGEPERDGVPARPGLMQRLANTEDGLAHVTERVEAVDHELRRNSGESLRDAVDRVEASQRLIVAAIPRRWARIAAAVTPIPEPPQSRKDEP
jgi:hypothetical protein